METKIQDSKYMLPLSIVIAGAMLSGALIYNNSLKASGAAPKKYVASEKVLSALEQKVLPAEGVALPVEWGDLGVRLVQAGVIDDIKFKAMYEQRGQFTEEYKKLLSGSNQGKIIINEENAGYLLNLLWALGLSNDNPILSDTTEIANPVYSKSGAVGSGFASTGGWTLAKGSAMNHYSRHKFFDLTPEQQALVDKVSRGIYRPCCNNSTHFPDCNHGMAMLGLLELMASQGVSEQDMWKAALAVNAYWFPNNYLTIATYMEGKGVEWKDVNPQEILGINYSSGSGYAKISAQVAPSAQRRGGNGCGVDAGPATPVSAPVQQRQQSGCGI